MVEFSLPISFPPFLLSITLKITSKLNEIWYFVINYFQFNVEHNKQSFQRHKQGFDTHYYIFKIIVVCKKKMDLQNNISYCHILHIELDSITQKLS